MENGDGKVPVGEPLGGCTDCLLLVTRGIIATRVGTHRHCFSSHHVLLVVVLRILVSWPVGVWIDGDVSG